MTRRTVQIRNRLGLHARAAARFVHMANRFRSHVAVTCHGQTMDGKSILGILLLAASQGAWLELETEGEDEADAAAALEALVARGFEEA